MKRPMTTRNQSEQALLTAYRKMSPAGHAALSAWADLLLRLSQPLQEPPAKRRAKKGGAR